MRLYPVPGGTWEATEADWKKAMKAKGLNPKDFDATKARDVPTGKKELIEFLNFYAVDVYRTGDEAPTVVDVDALRALHNPAAVRPSTLAEGTEPASRPSSTDLDDMFMNAPLGQQLRLSVAAIDAAVLKLNSR